MKSLQQEVLTGARAVLGDADSSSVPKLGFSSRAILVVGDLMLDSYLDTKITRISQEAPVPIAHLNKRWSVPGGAANVARNLLGLGCKCRLIGVRGKDRVGKELSNLLKQDGLSEGVIAMAGRETTQKSRVVSNKQQILRIDYETTDPIPRKTRERLLCKVKASIEGAGAIVVSDYAKGVFGQGFDGKSLAPMLIAAGHEKGLPVIVDPKQSDWSLYAEADIITPNATEFAAALAHAGIPQAPETQDEEGLLAAAGRLMELYGLGCILLTQGEEGMTLFHEGRALRIPSAARDVSDISGAGDTVVAVVAAAASVKSDLEAASRLANMAAGTVVAKSGTSPVRKSELEAELSKDEGLWTSLAKAGVATPPQQKTSGRCPQGVADASDVSPSSEKILRLEELAGLVKQWKANGERVAFANGCFDILHPGHVKLLEEAKAQGTRLIVAINSDASVRRLKGLSRPIQDERSRAAVAAALGFVDAVTLFEEDTPLSLINALLPDVIVKGDDYGEDDVIGAKEVRRNGGRVHIVRRLPMTSTSRIVLRAQMRGREAIRG